MARDDDRDRKLSRFNGRASDDYNLWRIRAETALRGRKLWSKLNKEDCSEEIKDEASSILVSALGDSAFRVCSSKVNEPLEMLSLLDKRYASSRASSRISVLTCAFSKRYQPGQDMAKYVDEFETIFAQLEIMGSSTAIPETFKAPLLLSSIGTNTPLESTVAALRLRDVDDLNWDSVTADLIQEYKRTKSYKSENKSGKRNKNGKHNSERTPVSNSAHALNTKGNNSDSCNFAEKLDTQAKSVF